VSCRVHRRRRPRAATWHCHPQFAHKLRCRLRFARTRMLTQVTFSWRLGALTAGSIVWQAKPFNMLLELCPKALLNYSFSIGQRLNEEFNQSWGAAATSADVYGMSVGAVPLLASHGVVGIHVGYNNGGHFPDVRCSLHRCHSLAHTLVAIFDHAIVTSSHSCHALIAHSLAFVRPLRPARCG
jgi:hypothetical protein